MLRLTIGLSELDIFDMDVSVIKSLMAGIYKKKSLLSGTLTIMANFVFLIFKKLYILEWS